MHKSEEPSGTLREALPLCVPKHWSQEQLGFPTCVEVGVGGWVVEGGVSQGTRPFPIYSTPFSP